MDERFEFDPAKSAANREKHGIDFVEAQGLWRVLALDVASPYPTELRRLRVGMLGERAWTVVYTVRRGAVRIISARRSRKEEVARYEQGIGQGSGTDHEP